MTNYDRLWKQVDSLSNKKGLRQSALDAVTTIYTLAKKEGQDAQVIKALLYQASLQDITDESGTNALLQWQHQIDSSREPAKSVLQSLLAEKYKTYFGQRRYQIYNRTSTVNYSNDDIATWSADDFNKKITALYLASLKDQHLLQQTRLEVFDPLVIKGNVRNLRPTLYDLLANRALDYFKSDERNIGSPAVSFTINNGDYFLPAAAFSQLVIVSKDIESLYCRAILTYQQLLAFHKNDVAPDALLDADLQRLQFVQQHAVMDEKDSLYEKALLAISEMHPRVPAADQAAYLVARLHADKAASYNSLADANDTGSIRQEYVVAAGICREVLQHKEESEGRVNCYNLLKEIEKKEINLSTEKVNLPEQAFRTLVRYRNTEKLYLRVALITPEQKKKLINRYDDNYWKELVAMPALRSWEQPLPATGDYQPHTTEIKIDAMPAGEYIVLASTNAAFSLDNNPLAIQYFYVSGISYVSNNNEYFVLNRETGKPLAGAGIQTWWSMYDYTSRSNKQTKGEKQVTDKNGYARLTAPATQRQGDLQLELTHGNDRLFMDDNRYVYYRDEDKTETALSAAAYEKEAARVFFFTDRSIYRPGQTVYFKGIAITKDFSTRKNKILNGISSRVFLRNANGEEVDSLELKTNEYGSYSGKFILPQGTLNGMFTLIDEDLDGEVSFSVEEYKRPSFYGEYEPLKGTYKLNDSITVTGIAKGYAGNTIDGARVSYRVQRVARFIYPWLWWKRGGVPQGKNIEISNGLLTTDATGSFKITFLAVPDQSINKDLEPVFDYKITADITDPGGETRSVTTTVPISYKALQLTVRLPATMPVDSLKNISISTQNLNGQFEPAQVSVVLYGLQAPERLVNKRYWQQPDQFTMTREEFIKAFPYDEYRDESDYRSWPKDKIFLRKIDSTNSSGIFELPKSKLPEGWYMVEVSTRDKYGETVKDVQYLQLYDEKSKVLPVNSYTWSAQKNAITEPGNETLISIGSAAKDVFLIQQVDKDNLHTADHVTNAATARPVYNFISLNGKQTFSFRVTETDRGGFAVYHFFVKNNRFYDFSNQVQVPWTNKELQVTYETFRDKTLPGSEEKWTVKISGDKKEKRAAEMLAGMYDASLDQFKPHNWAVPGIWETYGGSMEWAGDNNFTQVQSQERYLNETMKHIVKSYDRFNIPQNLDQQFMIRGTSAPMQMASSGALNEGVARSLAPAPGGVTDKLAAKKAKSPAAEDADKNEETATEPVASTAPEVPVQIRKNFNETAFFFPDLKTDSAGNISFGFTIPEALTKWKFQSITHTKDLAFGFSANTVVTQKPLMLQPNAPRFMREGDKMEFSAKVINLTDSELTGTVDLALMNTVSNQPVDGWFHNMSPTQFFTAAARQSTVVRFSIDIPYQYNSALSYRFVAKAGVHTDGEEASLPVLSNSMLVTESMPLPMRGNAAKNFRFEKLLQSGNSETLQQHALTVEFTTNPAWYAVQALPYLMDFPYECAEQTFNRYYANALATKIAGTSPRLQQVFEKWRTTDTAALVSNLQKNPELKNVLLEETPWVLDAKTETQQKKNIALLFDMVKMSTALSASFEKIKQMQSSNGGFVWFRGGPDDRFVTQYILTGIGHLKKLGALSDAQQQSWAPITASAISYLDRRIKEDYDNLLRHKNLVASNNLGYQQVQYLYMRSFFPEYNLPGASFTAVNYYRKQSQQYWLQQNRYMQGMIALQLFRSGDLKTAGDILKSLRQNAIVNEETGMYWKDITHGYYWYQAPVETQSLLIEAFSEITRDDLAVNDLKTWLLKQKQTQNWTSTKATADACYALLLQGSDWLNNTPDVTIKLGDKTISSAGGQAATEGTGYFKQTIEGPFVKPAMGEITVKIASTQTPAAPRPAWGAVYWQYFEQLDKITPAATSLALVKKLFIERNTEKGPVLEPIMENGYVKVGDKIKVRIELRADRDMEYVHMKDMRASCMEPVNVLSGYHWQDGLGYYESTKDASTSFFFGWLPKGTYVFEYPLFVTHTGNFSNGVTSIQCMYAPEFTSHSDGIRVNAEENK